jgi:ribosomal protein S16
MQNETQFVEGIKVFRPRENAPSFVKLDVVLDKERLMAWLETQEGVDARDPLTGKDIKIIRANVKESKGGKLYLDVNNWKPTTEAPQKPKMTIKEEFDALAGQPVVNPETGEEIPFN